MSQAAKNSTLVSFIAVGLLAVCVHVFQLQVINEAAKRPASGPDPRLVANPEILKSFSLGFDRVLADLTWLTFVQYYGDRTAVVDERLRYAPDYLKIVVALDPHFIRPYWFAAFVLAGDLNRQKEAEEFLDLGIRNNPTEWSLAFIAGFNQALYLKDYKKAAKYYRLAASMPNAPSWLASQAQVMEANIPRQIKEIRTWERMYKEGDPMVQEKARDTLQRLWSKVFWDAPTQVIKDRAKDKLEFYQVRLLPKE